MPVWVYGILATLITGAIGWIKFGKLTLLIAKIGGAVKATGSFLEEFATKYEDRKLTPKETEALGAKAQLLWKEWREVINVFK